MNPWRNVEELVASPSCTQSFMSMWRCHQPTWIWYLQIDRFEELWRNRDWRSFAVPRPSSRNPLFPELSPNETLPHSITLAASVMHSEASWALPHARRRAHLVAVISLWRLATTFQIQIQIQMFGHPETEIKRNCRQFRFISVLFCATGFRLNTIGAAGVRMHWSEQVLTQEGRCHRGHAHWP